MLMALKDKRQIGKNHSLFQSLKHASVGLKNVYHSERNFRHHVLIALLVVVAGLVYALNFMEWALILGCIAAVLVAEIFNSAIERLADLASHGRYHPLIKQAKDFAAGGVLVTAIFAAVIGLIIFGHKIF